MLAPLRARVPEPVLVRPPVVAAEAPDIVRVVPAVETSIVPVLAAVMVNARSVLAVTPVYCRVPPSKTKLAAAFVALPMLPAVPPLLIVFALKVPAVIVVTPV